jgi:hypothetical protein
MTKNNSGYNKLTQMKDDNNIGRKTQLMPVMAKTTMAKTKINSSHNDATHWILFFDFDFVSFIYFNSFDKKWMLLLVVIIVVVPGTISQF